MHYEKNQDGSNLPVVFSFDERNKLRTMIQEDQPWFAAVDVCDILGLKNPQNILKVRIDSDERSIFYIGRQGSIWFVNEAGLYNLILRSNKQEARRFRKWVTNEVLPTLRKTGSYHLNLVGLKTLEVAGQPCYDYQQLLIRIGLSTRSGSMSARRRKNPQEFHNIDRTWRVTSRFADYMLTIAKYRRDQETLRRRKAIFLDRERRRQLELFGEGGRA